MRYDLLDLRLFRAVVAEGSITAGGERLHLSLPSASARIRALEHHAGVALLERGRRGVRPTPAGTALARHAGEVLDDLVRLEGRSPGTGGRPGRPSFCWPAAPRCDAWCPGRWSPSSSRTPTSTS
ncbi:LysR family transcriptional regulator [Actinomycetospora sp. CA-053990]|uniref:LysR family transcriptional regulator n=1 Tax=Actinomycetospora sp. CA-053990 TaxID=3239891 RepID=UPI003D8EA8D1